MNKKILSLKTKIKNVQDALDNNNLISVEYHLKQALNLCQSLIPAYILQQKIEHKFRERKLRNED